MKKILRVESIDDLETLYKLTFGAPLAWSSSAKNLDENIEKAGYKVKTKYFHQYNLPGTPQILEQHSDRMRLIIAWEDMLHQIMNQRTEKIILSTDAIDQLSDSRKATETEILLCAEYIRANNPALQNIQMPTLMDKVHFIRGAVYGYPPENIQFFIQNYQDQKKLNTELEKVKFLQQQYNINVGLMRLTTAQADDLIEQLESQKSKKKAFTAGIEQASDKNKYTDSLGRPDPTGYFRFMEEKGYGD